jgi:hypothetical protein
MPGTRIDDDASCSPHFQLTATAAEAILHKRPAHAAAVPKAASLLFQAGFLSRPGLLPWINFTLQKFGGGRLVPLTPKEHYR